MIEKFSGESRPVGEWFEEMRFTRSHWGVGFALFMAFVIESWEMMIIILNGSSIAAEFGLDTSQLGTLIGAIFLGMIPGALMWGRLMDRLGRKKCVLLSLALYGPLPIISAFSTSYEMLVAVRFLCGVILSGLLVVTFPLFEELVPVKVRGRATVCLSAGWPVGLLVAIGITSLLLGSSWRWVLSFSSLAGFWAFAVYKLVPESPYWLAEKGRVGEAEEAIHRLSEGQFTASILLPNSTDNAEGNNSFFNIFRGAVARITVIQTIINFCFSWGYWGLASWMPVLLAKKGLNTPDGLSFMAISALFMFPGYIAASYLTGRLGRKKVMVVFVFISTCAGFGFANSSTVEEMYFWNFTLSFFSLGAWGIWNTWMGEIYATDTRSAGFAWGVTTQRVANSLAPVVIGAMLVSASFLQTVVFISTFLAISFIAAIFLPETEGKTLS